MAKYKCPTIGDCGKATTNEIMEKELGDDLHCPECGTMLVAQDAGGSQKANNGSAAGGVKPVPLIIAGVAALCILGGGGYVFMSKSKPTPEVPKVEVIPPPVPVAMPASLPLPAASSPTQPIPIVVNKPADHSGIPPSDAATKILRQQSEAELKNGNASEAEKASNKAAANETMKLAIAKMSQGKLEEAEQDLNDARKKDPKNSLVYYNTAILRLKQGRMDDALKEFEASFMSGFKYFDKIEQDTDLATVRKDPRFVKLVAQYRS